MLKLKSRQGVFPYPSNRSRQCDTSSSMQVIKGRFAKPLTTRPPQLDVSRDSDMTGKGKRHRTVRKYRKNQDRNNAQARARTVSVCASASAHAASSSVTVEMPSFAEINASRVERPYSPSSSDSNFKASSSAEYSTRRFKTSAGT